jgi:uncharacterized protein (DUF4415 family)
MKKEYDFSHGKRGQVIPADGKTRVTIYLDNEVFEFLRAESDRTGKGYHALINEALAEIAGNSDRPALR